MKKINYVLLLIGMIGFTTCSPKTTDVEPVAGKIPVKIWDRTFGGNNSEEVKAMIKTSDNGYIMLGISQSNISGNKNSSNNGGTDYWVVKVNEGGQKIWDKNYGGSKNDYARSIVETMDGGFIIAGYSNSSISGDKTELSKGDYDYWIIKINSNGVKVWDKTYGGDNYDYAKSIVKTSDGGVVVAGYSGSDKSGDKSEPSKGELNYWVVKLSATGEKIWDRTLGGNFRDDAKSIIETADKGFIVAGFSNSPLSGDKTNVKKSLPNIWLVKLNSKGDKIWDKTLGGNIGDVVSSIISTNDNNFIVAGYSSSGIADDKSEENKGGEDYWLIKINGLGEKIWDKSLGGNSDDVCQSICTTPDGGFVAIGYSSSNNSFDKTEARKGLTGVFDYWIVKIDEKGQKVWDKTIGGNDYDYAQSIISISNNDFIIAGTSISGISADKSEESKGSYDYWLVKLGFQ